MSIEDKEKMNRSLNDVSEESFREFIQSINLFLSE